MIVIGLRRFRFALKVFSLVIVPIGSVLAENDGQIKLVYSGTIGGGIARVASTSVSIDDADNVFISGAFRDMTMGLGSKFPIVELALSFGIKGILGSQFNYQKIRLNYKHWFYTSPAGYIEYQFEVGKIFGNLPYLFLEVHPGNEAYFYNKTSFNSMNSFEFVSDFFVHARIEHHWEGYILIRIPFIRKFLRWRLVTALRASWGTLSADNLALNESNHYDRSIRRSKDRPEPFTEGPFYGPFDKGPFAEASIGIENIFQLIRVDALWRLNYLDNRDAQLFSVRVTLNFDF